MKFYSELQHLDISDKFWNKIQSDPRNLVVGIEDGIVKAKSENFIYVTEDLVAKLFISLDCDFFKVKRHFCQDI